MPTVPSSGAIARRLRRDQRVDGQVAQRRRRRPRRLPRRSASTHESRRARRRASRTSRRSARSRPRASPRAAATRSACSTSPPPADSPNATTRAGIAAERGDVVAHPFERADRVAQPAVRDAAERPRVEEAERAEAVVAPTRRRPVVRTRATRRRTRAATTRRSRTSRRGTTRAPGSGVVGAGRPHVQRQARVLVGVADLHAGHDLAERTVERLAARRARTACRRRDGRVERDRVAAPRIVRRGCVRDAERGPHAGTPRGMRYELTVGARAPVVDYHFPNVTPNRSERLRAGRSDRRHPVGRRGQGQVTDYLAKESSMCRPLPRRPQRGPHARGRRRGVQAPARAERRAVSVGDAGHRQRRGGRSGGAASTRSTCSRARASTPACCASPATRT